MEDNSNKFPSFISLMAVTLSDLGTMVFDHEGGENNRVLFFIDQKSKNYSGLEGTIFSGNFIFQFEKSPENTLCKSNRNPSRIIYPTDKRITSYDYPNQEEFDNFLKIMNQISDTNQIYSKRINTIKNRISLQREKLKASA